MNMPLAHTKHPRNSGFLAMSSSGAAVGAGGGIPARSGGGDDRGRAWGGLGVLLARFRLWVGAVVTPAGSHGGGGRGELLSSLLRQGAWQCGAIGD
jgi:hypothetical protein